MDLQTLTYIVVGATFLLYIGIAIWARAGTTGEFYVAGKGVPPVLNGMATAADWMSAASFISMAGLIAFVGYQNSTFLMGWTGGYVLLALLLAPYLRKFGKFTVSEFIGDRFYSQTARLVAVACLIIASTTYVIGQMRGIGRGDRDHVDRAHPGGQQALVAVAQNELGDAERLCVTHSVFRSGSAMSGDGRGDGGHLVRLNARDHVLFFFE